jgi:ribosomal protein L11 methyltransferase
VIVNDFVAVRADFHKPIKNVQHEIIITPKMSFGTGHHATTYMMIENMRTIDFTNKRVLDFGTGTGVLAILAKKLGADEILAIDNDKWSIDNARENIEKNNCEGIELLLADMPKSTGQFDIILANINRNVIMENLPVLASQLESDGILFLSGLIEEDEPVIVAACTGLGFAVKNKAMRHNWLFLNLSKKIS